LTAARDVLGDHRRWSSFRGIFLSNLTPLHLGVEPGSQVVSILGNCESSLDTATLINA
jgi:hypothetical protein